MTVYEVVERVKHIEMVIDEIRGINTFAFADDAIDLLDEYKTMLYRMKVKDI